MLLRRCEGLPTIMFTLTFSADFTRGALLFINIIETLVVLYVALNIVGFFRDLSKQALRQTVALEALLTLTQAAQATPPQV